MKLISVNALKIGERLGSSIRMSNGNMLLRANTVITENMIKRLKTVGIYAVYIEDEAYADIDIRFALTDETKARILGSLELIQTSMQRGRKVDASKVKELGREVFQEVRIAALEPINMVSTFAVDNPVLLHNVNVAIITSALCARLNIRPQLAENYVLAALLHDIFLDDMRQDVASSYAHVKQLYDYLKASACFDATCYMAAAMHHERYNGSGGPRKMAGKQINEGGRIIAVADIFDNVSHGFAGFQRMPAYQAVEFLTAQSDVMLDPDVLKVFVSSVSIYPTGSTVTLNNGKEAIVVRQNDGMPTRPVVRVLSSNDPNVVYNMLSNNTIFIDKVAL